MVTFNQIARSYAAASKRDTREAARRYKAELKQQEIADASKAVKTYEDYIDVLLSIHKNCSDKIDWRKIKSDNEPVKPINKKSKEIAATEKLTNYKPGFITKLFKTQNKNIIKLKNNINNAIEEDQNEFMKEMNNYEEAHNDWLTIQNIAKGIELNNPKSYKEAIEYFQPFDDIEMIGSSVQFKFDKKHVEVEFNVNSSEAIPDFVLTQTSTGKLSKKNMPKGKYNELYQDYVCGSALRIAREVLSYLPIKFVIVHSMSELVNTKTGHLENTPLLSILVPSETIDKLNFNSLDPSDSMTNFVHNMKFTKTNGLSPVEKIKLSEFKS